MVILFELSFPDTVTLLHLRIQQHSLPPTDHGDKTDSYTHSLSRHQTEASGQLNAAVA